METAPIILFVYNRPGHARRTVESLAANNLASQSDLFVFSDASGNPAAGPAVQEVRQSIGCIRGFRSVTVIERESHFGLAKSVISGVTQILRGRGRVIVLEDDLLTTSDFLTFMNRALERYQNEPRLFSVSGFNFAVRPPARYPYDAFTIYRSSSIGWGTWEGRWQKVDWAVSDYTSFRLSEQSQRLFHRAGEDLTRMLALQMDGRIDSWAIRWVYAHFRHNALALLSLHPRVFHIGCDGSGTNSRRGSLKQHPLTLERKSDFQFPLQVEPEPYFAAELLRALRPTLARRMVRYLDKKFELREKLSGVCRTPRRFGNRVSEQRPGEPS
jgi:hypothetical protein